MWANVRSHISKTSHLFKIGMSFKDCEVVCNVCRKLIPLEAYTTHVKGKAHVERARFLQQVLEDIKETHDAKEWDGLSGPHVCKYFRLNGCTKGIKCGLYHVRSSTYDARVSESGVDVSGGQVDVSRGQVDSMSSSSGAWLSGSASDEDEQLCKALGGGARRD